MITAIVAMDDKHGIATNEGIPWDIPKDRHYFKTKTLNNTVVMGYKTYLSIGTPLSKRSNIVLTSHSNIKKGFKPARSINEVLLDAGDNFFVIGGQDIYKAFLPHTQKILITRIDGNFACNRFFPEFKSKFKLYYKSKQFQENDYIFRYEHWQRGD